MGLDLPPLFPNKWVRSCVAVNTTSGFVQWVVEGNIVLNETSKAIANSRNRPRDLSRKLVLGVTFFGGRWNAASHKVTNLNIYSSALPVEKMKSMTGGQGCPEEGDYLAWEDMEWIRHGQAKIETVGQDEPCRGDPYVDLLYDKFPRWLDCMSRCKDLGSRAPSVSTLQDWVNLQISLKESLYDKELNTMQLWLSAHDRDDEGNWRDFYTNETIQNYTLPWDGSGPDGDKEQNCAFLLDENTWGDAVCHANYRACMCKHDPKSYLRLRGLCKESSIDFYFKSRNLFNDSRELVLQGLGATTISYDQTKELWVLSVADSNVTGFSKAPYNSVCIGKHNWTGVNKKDRISTMTGNFIHFLI